MLALYIDLAQRDDRRQHDAYHGGLYARIPETILILLFAGSALTLGMVGFNAGLTGRRSPLTAVVLIVVLGAVIALIVDIDRPMAARSRRARGRSSTSQQQIGPPSSTILEESNA